MKILVVEDDAEIRRLLRESLETEGYTVYTAAAGAEALTILSQREIGLVVLDLGLPDMDGVEVVRRLRARADTAVLILSARADERQKIEALDAGADDYLTKPFGIGELLARVRVGLRHRGMAPGAANGVYELDGLRFDPAQRQVQRNGMDIHLTPIEHALLARLARDAGRVVTNRQLLTAAWGAEFVEHTHYLRIYMGQLRAKLEVDPAVPRFLLTETGVGYRLAAE